MLHAADQHGLAEILELRADAQQAAGFRKAAVGGHQQTAVEQAAITQFYLHLIRAVANGAYLGCAQQLYGRRTD